MTVCRGLRACLQPTLKHRKPGLLYVLSNWVDLTRVLVSPVVAVEVSHKSVMLEHGVEVAGLPVSLIASAVSLVLVKHPPAGLCLHAAHCTLPQLHSQMTQARKHVEAGAQTPRRAGSFKPITDSRASSLSSDWVFAQNAFCMSRGKVVLDRRCSA